ncbi:putative transcription factor tfiih subunit [Diaporthe ampelina]|uniref:General transcription and DNA repair factor IIH subunit TFB4 n=1 Tax=Diaporthe ampelina TaxID=1214573 RepID=A0A0G2FL91_9PEZI|nr:putative transcription factor tfiih subunit [Diaporthe ampelina]
MDAVDATDHYEIYATEETPSLCAVVIDTNPRAWAAFKEQLPISTALANILVFVNSHLAYSSTNQVALIASHTNRAVWLYPPPPKPKQARPRGNRQHDGDIEMTDADPPSIPPRKKRNASAANKYPQFAQIESSIVGSLHDLMSSTTEADLATTTTQISGALTLALSHINKTSVLLSANDNADASNLAAKKNGGSTAGNPSAMLAQRAGVLTGLHARILVVSVSESSPAQYIPTMNAVFAASHAGIPVDILSLHGKATFLQQASYITRGTFMEAHSPQGLLTYLLFGFASSISSATTVMTTTSNTGGSTKPDGDDDHGAGGGGGGGGAGMNQLVSPSTASVDFRAACFCHRKVIDMGFVCSICLSIFCEVPQDAVCLTCSNRLALGKYGARPAVVPRKRKKKRKLGLNGEPVGSEQPGSAVGTPRPG